MPEAGQVSTTLTNETDLIFSRLRELMRRISSHPDKNERVIVMISACILEGWDTRARIAGALEHLGLDRTHVQVILRHGTGHSPTRDRWKLDREGHYHLQPEMTAR